ncbi:hypothetical protein D3C76_1705070 [compost metagenome]
MPHLAGEMQGIDAYADDDNGLLPALVNLRVKHHQLCPTWLERCRGLTPMLMTTMALLPALVNLCVKHHQLCPTWLERCRGLTPMLAAACCQRW